MIPSAPEAESGEHAFGGTKSVPAARLRDLEAAGAPDARVGPRQAVSSAVC
jgi:hypothetical protein